MKNLCYLFLGLIMGCLPCLVLAESLIYQLNKLPGEISRNVKAHLGDLPKTDIERESYAYAAQQHIKDALMALGFYRGTIQIEVDRDQAVWQMDINIQLNEPTLLENVEVNVTGDAKEDQAFINLLADLPILPSQTVHHGRYEALKSSITAPLTKKLAKRRT